MDDQGFFMEQDGEEMDTAQASNFRHATTAGFEFRRSKGGSLHFEMEAHLPEDTYGAAFFAVQEFMWILYNSAEASLVNVIRCVFSLVVYAMNVLMQTFFLHFIHTYVVNPSVHHVQKSYQNFRGSVYDKFGKFQNDEWDKFPNKGELCHLAMTNRWVFYSILFLWTTSCIGELRTAMRMARYIYDIPHTDNGDAMFNKYSGNAGGRVIAVTRLARGVLFLLICIPKVVISVFLWKFGSRWLAATNSFAGLVMNAIAMVFVVEIDELLFTTLLPAHYRRQVVDTSIYMDGVVETPEQTELNAYKRSIGWVVLIMLLVFLYAEFQDVLPNTVFETKDICRDYLDEHLQPVCAQAWVQNIVDMFTKGFSATKTCDCYRDGLLLE